jgi:hypothetical protein
MVNIAHTSALIEDAQHEQECDFEGYEDCQRRIDSLRGKRKEREGLSSLIRGAPRKGARRRMTNVWCSRLFNIDHRAPFHEQNFTDDPTYKFPAIQFRQIQVTVEIGPFALR